MNISMLMLYCQILLLLFSTALSGVSVFANTLNPLIQQSNVQYVGAFRLPHGQFGGSSFDYGGTALAYNPTNNSLFLVGHDWHQMVAEVSIPSIVNSTDLARLNTATVLQPFADATEGRLGLIGDGNRKIGGLMVHNGKLYITGYLYYDGALVQKTSHFVRSSISLSSTGQIAGPYALANNGTTIHFVNGYMVPIPSDHQSALGKPFLAINGNGRISSANTWGPDAFGFDVNDLGQKSPVPTISYLWYSQTHPTLGQWNGTGPYYNATDDGRAGAVFPVGGRSILYFGRHGIGTFCYGEGTADPTLAGQPTGTGDIYCYDPTSNAKGTHAYPYVYQVWAYDVNEFIAVKNGSKNPWDPLPYTVWHFNLPFQPEARQVGGVAYDPVRQYIYLSQQFGDGTYPVIHVFKVNVESGGQTVLPPLSPTNLAVQ